MAELERADTTVLGAVLRLSPIFCLKARQKTGSHTRLRTAPARGGILAVLGRRALPFAPLRVFNHASGEG